MSLEKQNKITSQRLDYLDVLRGLAAISVSVQHIFGYLYHEAHNDQLIPLIAFLTTGMLDWGRFGVVLFFLISGFIIPKSLRANSPLKTFLIGRFFRLYPAYWITLLIIYISASYLDPLAGFTANQFVANLTMTPKLFHQNYMSGVFWTLFIEILFYLCCVFLFKLKLLENTLAIGSIAMALILITPSSIIFNYFFELHVPVQFITLHLSFLFLGNLVRLALIEKDRMALTFFIGFIALSSFSIPISSGLISPVKEASNTGFVMYSFSTNILAYALAISLFILIVHFKNIKNKFLIGAGEISYSLYLLHMTCFVILAKFIHLDSITNILVYLALCALLSYFVARLSFTFVEYPAIQLGKKITMSKNVSKKP